MPFEWRYNAKIWKKVCSILCLPSRLLRLAFNLSREKSDAHPARSIHNRYAKVISVVLVFNANLSIGLAAGLGGPACAVFIGETR